MKLTQEFRDIVQIIRIHGAISKKELAEKCNVSIPKAASQIAHLEEQGYLQIINGASSGGRIPQLVKVKKELFYSLGIDISTEYTRMGIVDLDGQTTAQYQESHNIEVPREINLDILHARFIQLCSQAEIAPSQVRGIGVGITGIIQEEKGICLSLRNTPMWKGFDVKGAFQNKFGIDNVLVVDSVKAMALAEKRFGGAGELLDFILFNIGIGLGAGIVVDGKLLSGARGTTGEIGHMHIRPSDDLCVCGNYGCLEAMASGWALLRKCKKALKEGVETTIGEGTDINSLSVKDIIKAANEGDKIAVMMIENTAKDLSIGIGSIINLLNPEKVFLAGGLIRHAEKIMMEPIQRGVRSAVIPWLQQNINIQLSEVGEWSAVRGAASMAIDTAVQAL